MNQRLYEIKRFNCRLFLFFVLQWSFTALEFQSHFFRSKRACACVFIQVFYQLFLSFIHLLIHCRFPWCVHCDAESHGQRNTTQCGHVQQSRSANQNTNTTPYVHFPRSKLADRHTDTQNSVCVYQPTCVCARVYVCVCAC